MSKLLYALVSLAVAQSLSHAAVLELPVNGSTTGGFDAAAPTSTATYGSSFFGDAVTFNSSTFAGETVGGLFGPLDLGTVSLLPPATDVFTGHTFTLAVTFSSSLGVIGGDTKLFIANLVTNSSSSSLPLVLDFSDTPSLFEFSNSLTKGSFSFSVNDLSLQSGIAPTGHLLGFVNGAQVAPVPEMETMFPLAMALGLAVLLERRGRQSVW